MLSNSRDMYTRVEEQRAWLKCFFPVANGSGDVINWFASTRHYASWTIYLGICEGGW